MSKPMNVLITSAGRRVTLLQHFAEACKPRGGKVYAGDLSSLAPAIYLHGAVPLALPPVKDAGYIPALLELVRSHQIAALIPTIDPELPLLGPHIEAFAEAGCTLLVSGQGFNYLTGDKWLTVNELAPLGVETPRSWLPGLLGLESPMVAGAINLHPCKSTVVPGSPEQKRLLEGLPDALFIKPRDGSASQNVFRIRKEQLAEYALRVPNAIIQEELIGEEITIDAFLAPDGTPLHYVPRKRIRTLAGESITGVTVSDKEYPGIEDWCAKTLQACAKAGARWAITLQGFYTTRGMVLTEINARFGGGVPLAFAAGGNYPEMALKLLSGERVPPRLGQYRRGLYFMRYMTEVFTEKLAW